MMTKRKATHAYSRLTPAQKVEAIRDILFCGGDLDHEWDVECLEDIARIVLDYDPKTGRMSWRPRQKHRHTR